MKKTLKKTLSGVYHTKNGKKIEGLHSGLSGDVSGLRGDVSGLSGDIDDCELTDEDRQKGVDVKDLIA